MSDNKRDLEFLFEIGALRKMQRAWGRFFSSEMANISEHIFRVIWLALILARKEGVKSEEKIIKLALVHDISEGRAGDVDYLSRQYVERDEESAAKDMLRGTSLESDFFDLWREMEVKETIEAKIVKDADNLDIDLELMENITLDKDLVDFKEKMREEILLPKLYTESAKKMWKEIYQSNPHAWHMNSDKNRFKGGDWKLG
jgi:putative hydrolase of HD superfamily